MYCGDIQNGRNCHNMLNVTLTDNFQYQFHDTDINIRQDQRVNVQSADHYQYYSQSDDTDDITTVD
jgi:hypothetical protein